MVRCFPDWVVVPTDYVDEVEYEEVNRDEVKYETVVEYASPK